MADEKSPLNPSKPENTDTPQVTNIPKAPKDSKHSELDKRAATFTAPTQRDWAEGPSPTEALQQLNLPPQGKRYVQRDILGNPCRRPLHQTPKGPKKPPKSSKATVQLDLVDTLGCTTKGYASLKHTRREEESHTPTRGQKTSIKIDLEGEGSLLVDLNGDPVNTTPAKREHKTPPPAITPSPRAHKLAKQFSNGGVVDLFSTYTEHPTTPQDKKTPRHASNFVDLTGPSTTKNKHVTFKMESAPTPRREVVDLCSVSPPVDKNDTHTHGARPNDWVLKDGATYKTVPVRKFTKRNGTTVAAHDRKVKTQWFNHPLKQPSPTTAANNLAYVYSIQKQEIEDFLKLKKDGGSDLDDSTLLAYQLELEELEQALYRQKHPHG